ILEAVAGLSLAFLSQRYWFARAWRVAGRIQGPALRKGMRGALLAVLVGGALVAVVAVVRNMRGTISRGSWWSAFFGLWLSSSILSYLLIKMISGADWLWGCLRSALSAPPQIPAVAPASPRGGARSQDIDHSRRHFVHAAGFLAGAVPFVSFAYGFVSERFRFETRQIDIPIANLPAALDGLRI